MNLPSASGSRFALTCLGFAAAALPAFGASYVGSAHDGFDYTSGVLIDSTLSGGTGWNAGGDASANTTTWATGPASSGSNRTIHSAGLSYGGSGYPAGTGLAANIVGGSGVGRSLGQTVDSGTFYFSSLVPKTVDQVRTVNFSFFNGTNERLAVGQIANNTNLRNPDGNADPDAATKANSGQFVALFSNPQNATGTAGVYTSAAPVAFDLGTTHLLVGKIEFDFAGGFADRFTLYVDPSDLGDEGSATPYMEISSNDFGAIDGFRMFAGSTSGGFTASAALFDEIRFGSTYDAVTGVAAIPEPSSAAALLGASGLSLAALRRRRRA